MGSNVMAGGQLFWILNCATKGCEVKLLACEISRGMCKLAWTLINMKERLF